MMVEKIEITRHKLSVHGELKLVDGELFEEDFDEMVSRLVSWKLGPVKPTRHFEMVYDKEKNEVNVDVYVTVTILESSESHVETFKYIFNKLMEFITLYDKEFIDIVGIQ
jgi:hypothetical protein